ncbi:MAG: GGDEF domain-containing protein [Oleispira sp.]
MGAEDVDNVEPNLPNIKRFLSIFKDVKRESRFRQEVLPKHRRLTFKLCASVAVAMPIFMLSDYMVVKPDSWGFFLVIQRLVQIGSCLVFLLIIPRIRSHLSYDTLLFSILFISFFLLELGSFTFVDDYALYALFDIIIMISLYASGILPVKLSLILCIYHTVVAIFIVVFVKILDTHEQIVMILGYSFSNCAGILLAIAQHRTARQEFLLKHSLREKTLQLRQLAYRDSLTNALNRRAFQDHFSDFERMALRMQGSQNGVYLIAADLDHFKLINDNFGHDVGDKVLVAFTALVESNIRPQDNVYRFGGEEFIIILQDCHKEIAVQRIDQIIHFLNENSLEIDELTKPVTCSFGITPILTTDTVDSVCIRADEALYIAKHNGRNQYIFDSGLDKNLNNEQAD